MATSGTPDAGVDADAIGRSEVQDEYQQRLNKWGALQVAARRPGCVVDPGYHVLLDIEEGQWYSTLTGGDPPYIDLGYRCEKHGTWEHIEFNRDIGEVLRGLLATEV